MSLWDLLTVLCCEMPIVGAVGSANLARVCIKWHSVVAGVVAILCGLPLTALLFLVFRTRWNGE